MVFAADFRCKGVSTGVQGADCLEVPMPHHDIYVLLEVHPFFQLMQWGMGGCLKVSTAFNTLQSLESTNINIKSYVDSTEASAHNLTEAPHC